MIVSLANEVRMVIKNMINNAGMFSMLIDECKDNAGHED